jgi:hypothetical protein
MTVMALMRLRKTGCGQFCRNYSVNPWDLDDGLPSDLHWSRDLPPHYRTLTFCQKNAIVVRCAHMRADISNLSSGATISREDPLAPDLYRSGVAPCRATWGESDGWRAPPCRCRRGGAGSPAGCRAGVSVPGADVVVPPCGADGRVRDGCLVGQGECEGEAGGEFACPGLRDFDSAFRWPRVTWTAEGMSR